MSMKIRRSWLLVAVFTLAGCLGGTGTPESSTTFPEASTSSAPPAPTTTTTTQPTTTTTVDPTETFLSDVPEAPTLWAITEGGYRRWQLVDDVWVGESLVRFEEPGTETVPFAAGSASGVVYQGGDGSVRLAAASGEQVLAEPEAVLYDVVTDADDAPVAIVGPDGILGIDGATGELIDIFEARVVQETVSYGAGQLLTIRGTGEEAVASLVTRTGQSIRLDLLAPGNPVSAVLTPDGREMVFSTDDSDEALVYTLAVGSQGPAAAHRLGVDGRVERLDTDGTWASGVIDDTPFLLDLMGGEVYFGPDGVRFAFDRSDRALARTSEQVHLDGRFFGYIRSAREGSIRFDEADYLTGEDAAEAAEAAGDESPPPNDFYIRNTSEETERIPLADDVEIRIQANIPEAGVGVESVTVDQWLRLLEGDDSVVDFEWYGQGQLPYWITIEGGEAVLLEEFYLP
jgi:hypothetical protein